METENSFKSKLSHIQHKVGSVEGVSQQRIASQKPRGTKLDPSGTFINLKGSRNYTPYSLSVGPDEMFEDIVIRGLRSDGLSTKLGIKNNKNLVAQLVSSLLENDSRHDEAMRHFYRKRQRNNSAKNIFSTMTVDELKFIKKELFPSIPDGPEKNMLLQSFANSHDKVKGALNVLEDFQESLKYIINTTELFSAHNFQTRGFFMDMFSTTCTFISDLLEQGLVDQCTKQNGSRCNKKQRNKGLQLSGCVETMNDENISGSDQRIHSKNCYRQSNTTTVVVSRDKIISMNSDLGIDKNNDCIDAHDIANIEFEEVHDGEKGWIPIEIMQTCEEARMLVVKGSPKSEHSLDNSNNNNIVNLMKNQETVVVECDFQLHDCISSDDKYKEVDSHSTLDLDDSDHNVVDSGSSVVTMPRSFVTSKMSDESLKTILSLGGGSSNKSYSPSETSLYLCTQESAHLSNNSLHGETYIPIEIEMLQTIPHSTQDNGSMYPSKRQKHTDSYNLD